MRYLTVAMLIFCGGCQFAVHALPFGDNAADDLGVAADFATPGLDLAGGGGGGDNPDLALGPDLADPCGTAPPLTAGSVAAQCVIGNPPTIDGDLADWPAASMMSISHASSAQATGDWDPSEAVNDADASARFYVKWDRSYLYVAVAITDDIRQTPHDSASTDNDAFEIFLDGAHNRSQPYDATDWQLVFSANDKKAAFQTGTVTTFPAMVSAVGGSSPSWNLEAAIPWAMVGGAPTPGRVLGFDLKLDDNDAGHDKRERSLVLYYTATGAGNPACTAPYCRTDAFGAVQLQGR